ncbi:unnamed protein product [Colias eurytheme]|nr:unnamed protein product [Colias eurytheme]
MKRHSRSLGNIADLQSEIIIENGNVASSTNKIKGKFSIIKEYLIDYTASSNLHGLRYIGEKQRTIVEKIFWLFMFSSSFILCSVLIHQIWIKWNERPVIVSFAETYTPVWQIPYPAVTICVETKVKQSKFNFTEYFRLYNDPTTYVNLTVEERLLYEDVMLLCDERLAPPYARKFSIVNETIENLRELAPDISETISACRWKNTPTNNCSELFSTMITQIGFCYTFNSLGAEDLFRVENLHTDYKHLEYSNKNASWSLEGGYPPNTPLETYPHRGSGYGAKAGLSFSLRVKKIDLDYLCTGPIQGFKIYLHNPAELPHFSQQYFRSPFSQEIIVAVKPKMMTTSEGLRPYDAHRRQCYFPSERYLHYFKVYTQANCEMECLTNFTFARCGCVHFGLPHGPGMAVCNAGSVACLTKAQMELEAIEIKSAFASENNANDTLGEARKVAARCECLPACTSIEYEAETSKEDYDWMAFLKALEESTEDLQSLVLARVRIFFKEGQFIASRRSELYSRTDFLANCGGLLGLFMGFSILSVAEILYFFSLRLCCVIWNKHTKRHKVENIGVQPKPAKITYIYMD